jgi:signal transduction histidine kinase/DNA-binding response OmpR family regulator
VTSGPDNDPFAGEGEMAALMRATDWSATPLGPADSWPQSLRTVVRVVLTSRFAMWMGWGPDLTFFYNDAYGAMTLGAKHPWALGRPSREVWSEIWPDIEPRIAGVLQTGRATWDDKLQLFLERSGYTEETYHTFSYSPITDDSGTVSGNLCVVTEETERVLSERRMALLRDTAAAIAGTMTEAELYAAIESALVGSKDLPFTLTYVFDETATRGRLVCRTGIPGDHPAAVPSIDVALAGAPWHFADAEGEPQVVELSGRFSDLPTGPWQRPPTRALVLPIAQPGQKRAAGMFVAGLNPFRPLDDGARSFVELFVGQLAAGIANVHAYEEERRRAHALAELDRAKTTFFSNVSHEFRTPLTLLLGPLDEARRAGDEVPRAIRDQLDVAHRNSQRLLKLVNTLLDFSRIEAGRVRARFEPVDLAALTADLASTFRSAIEKAGLDFVVDCSPLPAPVYVDREMWEKVVLNLISNAFKFTLAGRVVVAVTEVDGRVLVSVADTGAGIAEHELPRVFERFHRVEGAPGRSHEGSGIGLALVQELVKLHGGELTVTSELGQGSAFTVSMPFGAAHLPFDQVAETTTAGAPQAESSYVQEALRWLPGEPAAGQASANGADASALVEGEPDADVGRVLLVDDNADMRDYAQRLLSERWYVDTAGNGREALAAARARRPDVIVSDVMMPELDGFGLLRELRADAELRAIPVIMLSARAGEEARIEGLTASADDYLVKPFSARDLMARVEAQFVKGRIRDIEQRHARRMTRLFTHAPVAVAVLSGPDHRYELANSRYRELIGGRDVVGKPIREALPELEGQGVFDLLDRVRSSGEPFLGHSVRQVVNRGYQGAPEECYFDFVYQPVLTEDGEVETIVVVAYDVTALAAAKHEAENANRLKDEFLATLSHELRTPLNAVLGYTQMVRGGVIESQRMPGVLETIERNARLQEQLISDVLDVSRIITGKLRLDIGPVDLTRVIQEAVETVTPAATAKGVRLQSAIDQPGVPVAGDAQRLQQIAWNLLSNAIKFTPRGGRVQVRLERVNSHVELTVSDTGEGIASEFLPHLFQRFRQADSTFTRNHGGLGLGLAISRHLVEAHGGRIEAMSPGKGHGTTVRVELPLMIVHDSRFQAPNRVHPAIDVPASARMDLANLDGIRVLLVDDDADALEMARDTLTIAGARVVTASSGADALAALDRETFTVAVLDIGLPRMDGYELLASIRRRPKDQQRDIPAAALTAYARAADRTRSLQAGFQLHLSKPVEPNELAAAVLALGGRARDDSSRSG